MPALHRRWPRPPASVRWTSGWPRRRCWRPPAAAADTCTSLGDVDAVGQDDDGRLARRVDPDRRAGEAGVAEALALREQLAAGRAVARVHVPAAGPLAAGDGTGRRHEPHAERAQDALAVQLAAVQEHAGVAGQVVGGAEQAGVAGDPAQRRRPRVVDLADEPVAVPLGRRGRPRLERVRGPEAGVAHAERLEDVGPGELVERLAADPLDQLAEDDEAHVAVAEPRPRLRLELESGHLLEAGGLAVLVVGQGVVRDQPARVREQVLDRHLALAVGREVRPVGRDLLGQPQLALLDQDERRRGSGDRLGERRHVEDGVGRHRHLVRVERAVAVRLAKNDVAAVDDEDDGPGAVAALDRRGRGVVDAIEPVAVDVGRRDEREEEEGGEGAHAERVAISVGTDLRSVRRFTDRPEVCPHGDGLLHVLVAELPLHLVGRVRLAVHLDVGVDEEVERRPVLLWSEDDVAARSRT